MAANSGGMRQTEDEFHALPGESLRPATSSKCESWYVGRERDRHRIRGLASGGIVVLDGMKEISDEVASRSTYCCVVRSAPA
jgi:hypothetical protein